MGKVAIFTLGCKVNQAESEELAMRLSSRGHALVSDPRECDVCVVNTCTVTAESDRKTRKLLRLLHRRGSSCLVAAGCYPQVHPEACRGFPGVSLVMPNSRKESWEEEIAGLLPPPEDGDKPANLEGLRTRGFLKVQDGCEKGCSYCIVPLARGPERSRPADQVKEVASGFLRRGCAELVLSGVNLGRYGAGTPHDLAALVRDLLHWEEGFRLRLSSIEPDDLRWEWIRQWSEEERVCPHLHLPLQSGDPEILREMGRGYLPGRFLELTAEVKKLWPRAAITTEVIVGYPGEDREAFRRTVEVLERAGVSRVHVFRFSPRPHTRAWKRREEVDPAEAERRSAHLRRLAEKWRLGYVERHLGETRQLLVERKACREGQRIALGTTEDYIKAFLVEPQSGLEIGRCLQVRLEGVKHGLALAKPTGREWERIG